MFVITNNRINVVMIVGSVEMMLFTLGAKDCCQTVTYSLPLLFLNLLNAALAYFVVNYN